MSIAFITKAPDANELERLRLALSTFCDGSGQLVADNATLPGWRDFERAVAAILGGVAAESKAIFDVVVPATLRPRVDYGISVKSKNLTGATAIGDLQTTGRVYLEVANSPAKFWTALAAVGIDEAEVKAQRQPQRVGEALLATVEGWHRLAAAERLRIFGRTLDLARSVYLVLSYSDKRRDGRDYQWHSFSLTFPPNLIWRYRSAKSLTADDPAHAGEALFDWYPFSGGQLKYYPRASAARYYSPSFKLLQPRVVTVQEKAGRYFPVDWVGAGGKSALTLKQVAEELRAHAKVTDNQAARTLLNRTADDLERL